MVQGMRETVYLSCTGSGVCTGLGYLQEECLIEDRVQVFSFHFSLLLLRATSREKGQLNVGVSKAICIHGGKVAALMNCVWRKLVAVRMYSKAQCGGTYCRC